MRRALRRLLVRLAVALESPPDLDDANINPGRVPSGDVDARLTTGEIQVRGQYWHVAGPYGQRLAILAFYPGWDELVLVSRVVDGLNLGRGDGA